MIRKALFTAALLLTPPHAVLAHDSGNQPQVAPNSTILNISASGKSSQKPDLAQFSAGVATTGKTAREALSANSAAMNRAIRALRASGIAERDIQTSNLSIEPVYANRNRQLNELEQQVPPIIGYRANN